MKIYESGENYLETIYVLCKEKGDIHAIDLCNELGFSKPTVSVALKKFRENRFVNDAFYGDSIRGYASDSYAEENVILLENHGALSVGNTVIDAMNALEAAEASAKILTLTKFVGTPQDLSKDECDALWKLHEQRMHK